MRSSMVLTTETIETRLLVDGAVDRGGVEARLHDSGHAADDAAQQDRQPADVEQRQAGEPGVVGQQTEVQRRRDGAPPVVAVGQDGAFGSAAGARGVDDRVPAPESRSRAGPCGRGRTRPWSSTRASRIAERRARRRRPGSCQSTSGSVSRVLIGTSTLPTRISAWTATTKPALLAARTPTCCPARCRERAGGGVDPSVELGERPRPLAAHQRAPLGRDACALPQPVRDAQV